MMAGQKTFLLAGGLAFGFHVNNDTPCLRALEPDADLWPSPLVSERFNQPDLCAAGLRNTLRSAPAGPIFGSQTDTLQILLLIGGPEIGPSRFPRLLPTNMTAFFSVAAACLFSLCAKLKELW